MSAKVDERIQGINLIETYGYGTNKEVVYRKEKKTWKNSKNWHQCFDHPNRILIIGSSKSGKTNSSLNLLKQQNGDDYNIIDENYLYVKDQNKVKYQYRVKDMKKMVSKSVIIQKSLVKYSNDMQHVYKIWKSTMQIENVKYL